MSNFQQQQQQKNHLGMLNGKKRKHGMKESSLYEDIFHSQMKWAEVTQNFPPLCLCYEIPYTISDF